MGSCDHWSGVQILRMLFPHEIQHSDEAEIYKTGEKKLKFQKLQFLKNFFFFLKNLQIFFKFDK